MLHVSFAKRTYKSLTRGKKKKIHSGFRNWKKALTYFIDRQQSKCHLAALTFEDTIPQCLDVIAIANLFYLVFKLVY